MKQRFQHRFSSQPVAFAACVLLTACSILPESKPLDVYLLPETSAAPASAPAGDAHPLAISLRVAKPGSGFHLAGSRIVVIPQDNQLSVYAGASWSDPAPVLVRNRLLDAFRVDGRIGALSNDDKTVSSDYELSGDLRAFQSEYRNGKPEVLVTLDSVLVHSSSRRIIASHRFEIRQPVTGTQLPEVIQAFGKAGDALSTQVVGWTVEQTSLAVLVATQKTSP